VREGCCCWCVMCDVGAMGVNEFDKSSILNNFELRFAAKIIFI
jgi:hypothetical protein